MHVLITGATGFIGRALCAELHRRGHEISALSRNTTQAAAWLPPGTNIVSDLAHMGDEVPDAVVNLAGESIAAQRWNSARKRLLMESRVGTTRRLVEYLRSCIAKPRVLVSGSAIGWYGDRGDEVLDEESVGGRDLEFQVQLCRAWEAEAQQAADLGLRVCRLRTGLVLERNGGALAKMLLPMGLGITGVVGDGRQWMSWIHRADLVSIILRLCEDETLSGVFNGTAPQPVTNHDFVAALSETLEGPAVLPLPAKLLRLAAGEMSELLLGGQKVLPRRIEEADFGFRYPELRPALRHILRRRDS